MKQLFTLIFFFTVVKTFAASDTLTRAQVYDFSVGDIFDYKHYNYTNTYDPDPNPSTTITTDYSRYLITAIYYSPDSLTKYIQREKIFPQVKFDTIVLQNLSGQEVYLDTSGSFTYGGIADTIAVAPTSRFYGRDSNMLVQVIGPASFEQLVFIQGLGAVLDYTWGGALSIEYYDSLELIYYSKDTETWGKPYYDFPTAIQQLSPADNQITLFPTVNDGTFNIKIRDAGLLPVNFAVYDITGREIKRVVLNNASNSVNLENCSAGLYIWQAITQNELMQTGKMVLH